MAKSSSKGFQQVFCSVGYIFRCYATNTCIIQDATVTPSPLKIGDVNCLKKCGSYLFILISGYSKFTFTCSGTLFVLFELRISLCSPFTVFQRFAPTHRRNTSDHSSSDSSSTANSPETQHNVSGAGVLPVQFSLMILICYFWWIISRKKIPLIVIFTWKEFCVSLLRLLGLGPGETPIIWPRSGCAIMWVFS